LGKSQGDILNIVFGIKGFSVSLPSLSHSINMYSKSSFL